MSPTSFMSALRLTVLPFPGGCISTAAARTHAEEDEAAFPRDAEFPVELFRLEE